MGKQCTQSQAVVLRDGRGRVDAQRTLWPVASASTGISGSSSYIYIYVHKPNPKGPKYQTIGYLEFPYQESELWFWGRYLIVGYLDPQGYRRIHKPKCLPIYL